MWLAVDDVARADVIEEVQIFAGGRTTYMQTFRAAQLSLEDIQRIAKHAGAGRNKKFDFSYLALRNETIAIGQESPTGLNEEVLIG